MVLSAEASLYRGRQIALLTQHGKERVIGPVLEPALNCRIELVSGYDTDLLGTFTRDIPRAGTQLDAARRKARIGMELSGLPCGLASEGSFGPDPFAALFPWNIEMLIFIDAERDLEIVGTARGRANFAHLLTSDWAAAEAFADRLGFPEHHLVVRPQSEENPRICKGIASWAELRSAFERAPAQSSDGQVFLESDLRAHANPSRMNNIRLAAQDLLTKILSPCPACGVPGFSPVERVPGLPCGACGAPTRETRAEVWGCVRCANRQTRDCTGSTEADPAYCDYCNP